LARLASENGNLAGQLARTNHSIPLDAGQSKDLIRLRGEVRALRQKTNELAQLASAAQADTPKSPPPHATNFMSKESWAYAGYASPEAALQSLFWAKSTGNEKAWIESVCNSNLVDSLMSSPYIKGDSEAERSQSLMDKTTNWIGLSILNEIPVDDDTILLQAELSCQENGQTNIHGSMQEMKRIGGTWKLFNEYMLH